MFNEWLELRGERMFIPNYPGLGLNLNTHALA